jgi:hypothetical protein
MSGIAIGIGVGIGLLVLAVLLVRGALATLRGELAAQKRRVAALEGVLARREGAGLVPPVAGLFERVHALEGNDVWFERALMPATPPKAGEPPTLVKVGSAVPRLAARLNALCDEVAEIRSGVVGQAPPLSRVPVEVVEIAAPVPGLSSFTLPAPAAPGAPIAPLFGGLAAVRRQPNEETVPGDERATREVRRPSEQALEEATRLIETERPRS